LLSRLLYTSFSDILHKKENTMPQTMTLHERLAVGAKVVELEKQGKFAEAKRLHNTLPIQPYLAKFLKDHIGLEALLKSGLNLTGAEAEYGPEFLSH
jgi:hypothetical protein